jgi:hypothetical protein
MHNLEKQIAEWRKTVMTARSVGDETIDELESHLRENVEQLVRSGMAEPEAFQKAVAQLGGASTIASEFRKLEPTWLPVKLVIGFGIVLTLAMLVFVIIRFGAGRMNLLLAFHVFLVSLGFSTTFLIGTLGVCFVGQRCFSNHSRLRSHSLSRVTFTLACIGASMTAVGIVLAMIWAKIEWGRYWAWDIKETGAFAVLLWQLLFLFIHRFARITARGILTVSLIGNIIVSLGWFGSNLISNGPHAYVTLSYSLLLLVGVGANLVFFITGLAPAGWLRPGKVS